MLHCLNHAVVVNRLPCLNKVLGHIKFLKTTWPVVWLQRQLNSWYCAVACYVPMFCLPNQIHVVCPNIFVFVFVFIFVFVFFIALCFVKNTCFAKTLGKKISRWRSKYFFWKISTPIFQFNHPQTVLTDRTLQVKSNCQNVKGQKKPNALQLRQRSPTVVTSVVTQLWVLLPWTHTCWVTVVKGPLSALCVDIPANRWDTSKRTCWFIQAKDHSTVPNVTKPSRHLRSSSGTF